MYRVLVDVLGALDGMGGHAPREQIIDCDNTIHQEYTGALVCTSRVLWHTSLALFTFVCVARYR